MAPEKQLGQVLQEHRHWRSGAFVSRELLYCYGRLIGAKGIAVWSYLRLHQHAGETWPELAGYAWPSISQIGADLGMDKRVVRATLEALRKVGLVSLVRARDVFDAAALERMRRRGRERGEELNLQPASLLLIPHEPAGREEFARLKGDQVCGSCSRAALCRASQGRSWADEGVAVASSDSPGEDSAFSVLASANLAVGSALSGPLFGEGGAFSAPLGGEGGAFSAPPPWWTGEGGTFSALPGDESGAFSAPPGSEGGAFSVPLPWWTGEGGTEDVPPEPEGGAFSALPGDESGAFSAPPPRMENMESMEKENGKQQQLPVVVVRRDTGKSDILSGLLAVLDRVRAQQLRTLSGRRLTRTLERCEVALALLSGRVSPEAVSRVPTDLVEQLLVLSWCLRSLGPDRVLSAVEKALEQHPEEPVRRLSFFWGVIPGAADWAMKLQQDGRRGGKAYREVRKWFIVANRFRVGPGVLERFRELCRRGGTGSVQELLEKAVRAGRPYVTLAFVREGLGRRAGEDRADPEAATKQGRCDSVVAGGAENAPPATESGTFSVPPAGPAGGGGAFSVPPRAESEAATPARRAGGERDVSTGSVKPIHVRAGAQGAQGVWNGRIPEEELVRFWLEDYGIVEPALREICGTSYPLVRGWLMYLEQQEKLSPESRRAILVQRLRSGDAPPRRWLRLAELLPPLNPVEESMLEQNEMRRLYQDRWSEDVLKAIGEEAAEQWFRVRRALMGDPVPGFPVLGRPR